MGVTAGSGIQSARGVNCVVAFEARNIRGSDLFKALDRVAEQSSSQRGPKMVNKFVDGLI